MPVGGVICSDLALCPPCENDGECASGNCINGGDLCPFIGEANWFLDTNNDDIGDQCQCGDGFPASLLADGLTQIGDGDITALDIGGTAQCANGQLPRLECDSTIVDTNGDNATTAVDISGVAQAANGVLATSELLCVRNLDTTQ